MNEVEIQPTLQRELGAGEKLLWWGRPRQGIPLRANDLFLIPFSLLWAGFAVFWEVSAIRQGAGPFFALWGVPFLLIGAYIVFGRFFVDSLQRSETCLGLTDQRVLIVSGIFTRQVKSLALQSLSDLSLSEKADGSGTITFGPAPQFSWFTGSSWPGSSRQQPPSFDMIDQARQVYDRIRRAQQELLPTRT